MRHSYIFIGLTPTEQALLESLFALDQDGGDELVRVSRPQDAHLIVANGDDRAVVDALRAANPRALMVLVGQPKGADGGGLPALRRPLEMAAVTEVMSQLDWPADLLGGEPSDFRGTFSPSSSGGSGSGRGDSVPPAPRPDPSAFAPTTASMPLHPPSAHGAAAVAPHGAAPSPVADAVSARATWLTSEHGRLPAFAPGAPGGSAPPATRPAGQIGAGSPALALPRPPVAAAAEALPDVLVVAGELGRRGHTLPGGLRRLGFQVRLVQGLAGVQATFAQRKVPVVFLDQASLGADLLPLARWLAAQRAVAGEAPHVAVVARRGSGFDRLRARLLGCAWITVPVERTRLLAYLARRGLHPAARSGL